MPKSLLYIKKKREENGLHFGYLKLYCKNSSVTTLTTGNNFYSRCTNEVTKRISLIFSGL